MGGSRQGFGAVGAIITNADTLTPGETHRFDHRQHQHICHSLLHAEETGQKTKSHHSSDASVDTPSVIHQPKQDACESPKLIYAKHLWLTQIK